MNRCFLGVVFADIVFKVSKCLMALRELIILHIKELPFFTRQWLSRCEFIATVVKANPDIPLGGLPVAPKSSRFGSGPSFLPTRRLRNDKATSDFIRKQKPVIVKPLYGSQSRNISLSSDVALSSADYAEPMLLQSYQGGKEYSLCVANYGNDFSLYSVVEIVPDGNIWHGDGSYTNKTKTCQTDSLKESCRLACDEVGLHFGRLDVKADSLSALKAGDFHIMEVNGSTAIDMRLYTDASADKKRKWLRRHWQRLIKSADSHQKDLQVPWGLLASCLLFATFPRWSVLGWNQFKKSDLTASTQPERGSPGSGAGMNVQ